MKPGTRFPAMSSCLFAETDAEEPERFGLAAQLPLSHVPDLELIRQPTLTQQRLRHQHATLERAALRLDPCRDVHGVAAVDDVLFDVANLGRDDGTAVEAGLELGHETVSSEVA